MAFGQFNTQVSGTRKSSGQYVDGVWVPTNGSSLSIAASIQPASENELKLLPQGRREGGAYALRSKSEIKEGDVFTLYGDAHEVVKRQVWQNGVLPHYLGVAVRELKTP